MNIEIKKLKFHKGHEGEPCAECEVWADGVLAGVFAQDEWGGEPRWYTDPGKEREAYNKLEAYAKSLPSKEYILPINDYKMVLDMDVDLLVDDLIQEAVFLKNMRKSHKSGIVFWYNAVGADNFQVVKVRMEETREEALAYVVENYGNKPGFIVLTDDNFDHFRASIKAGAV